MSNHRVYNKILGNAFIASTYLTRTTCVVANICSSKRSASVICKEQGKLEIVSGNTPVSYGTKCSES